MALASAEGTTGENNFPTGPPGPARLRCSPVCAGSGRGAAHARLGPEPAEVGAQGRCWLGEPGRGDGGRGLPAAGAAGALSAGFGSCRFPSLRSSITAARAVRVLRAGLRAAERAGTGRGAEGSGARMQVRPAAPRPGERSGRRSPRGPSSAQPGRGRPGPALAQGRARRGLGWAGPEPPASSPGLR